MHVLDHQVSMRSCVHRRKVLQLMDDGDFSEARKQVRSYTSTTISEMRMMAHVDSLIDFRQGNLTVALASMIRARDEFGEQVSLNADIMQSYYLLGDIPNWQRERDHLKNVLSESAAYIGTENYSKACVFLGKAFEESGEVGQALVYYQKALTVLDLKQNRRQYYFAIPQLLRVGAFFGGVDGLSELYYQAIRLGKELEGDYINFEIGHALMLAEFRLFGAKTAELRLMQMLQDTRLSSSRRRLLIFDFLEECLWNKVNAPDFESRVLTGLGQLDPFESVIYKLCYRPRADLVIEADKMGFNCYIRLLCLQILKEENSELRREHEKRILFLIGRFCKESQRLWRNRVDLILAECPKKTLRVIEDGSTIKYEGQLLRFRKNSPSFLILLLLTRENRIDLFRVAKLVWQSEFNPSYYDRIRMTVRRLNDQMFNFCGVSQVVLMDEGTIFLNRKVHLTS